MKPGKAPARAIVHVDILSTDEAATRDFLEAAFAWKVRPIPLAHYALFTAAVPPHGGVRRVEPGEPPGARAYVAVDSLDEARDRILKAGGRILGDVQGVPGFGRFFLFEAPGRVVFAAFEQS